MIGENGKLRPRRFEGHVLELREVSKTCDWLQWSSTGGIMHMRGHRARGSGKGNVWVLEGSYRCSNILQEVASLLGLVG